MHVYKSRVVDILNNITINRIHKVAEDTTPQTGHAFISLRTICVLAAAGVTAATLCILLLTNQPASTVSSFTLAIAVFTCNAASVPLFVSGLRGYKQDVRRAYLLICLGAILYGVAQLQFPAIVLFHLEFLAASGVVVFPFILSVSFLFFGLRRFGRLLQVRSHWLSALWAYGVATVVAVAAAFLPHIPIPGTPDIAAQSTNGINFFITIMVLFTTFTVYKTRSVAAERYHNALGWMLASTATLLFAALHYAIIALILPLDHWYFTYGLPIVPSLIGTMLLFQAGHAFSKVHSDEAAKSTTSSAIDAIIYTASLASNPSEIEPLLDPMRVITARRGDDMSSPLAEGQEESLQKVYLELENYLIHKEALRAYSQADIRTAVRNRFQSNSSSLFWKTFHAES